MYSIKDLPTLDYVHHYGIRGNVLIWFQLQSLIHLSSKVIDGYYSTPCDVYLRSATGISPESHTIFNLRI